MDGRASFPYCQQAERATELELRLEVLSRTLAMVVAGQPLISIRRREIKFSDSKPPLGGFSLGPKMPRTKEEYGEARLCQRTPEQKDIPGAKGISGVRLNGKPICFPDAQPGIVQNRTLVPVRFVSEALGAKVDWDGDNRIVTISQPGKVIKLAIDQIDVTVNDQVITLDVPAKIYFDRTFVPLRFVSEALGCKVDWDPNLYKVYITTQ